MHDLALEPLCLLPQVMGFESMLVVHGDYKFENEQGGKRGVSYLTSGAYFSSLLEQSSSLKLLFIMILVPLSHHNLFFMDNFCASVVWTQRVISFCNSTLLYFLF